MNEIEKLLQGAGQAVGNVIHGGEQAVGNVVQGVEHAFAPQQAPQQGPAPQQIQQAQPQQSPIQNLFTNASNTAQQLPKDLSDIVHNASQGFENTLGAGQKALGSLIGQATKEVPQIPQQVGNFIQNNPVTKAVENSPITQEGESLGKNYLATLMTASPNTGALGLENALSSPQQREQSQQQALQEAQKFNPSIATTDNNGNLNVNIPEYLKGGLKGTGALLYPGQTLATGALNVPFQGVSDLFQGKNPLKMNVQKTVAQGIDFGALLAPLSEAAGFALKPLMSKINPVEIGNINQYINMAKNATTADARSAIIKLAAKRIALNVNAAGIEGAAGMGAYGAFQPAKNLEQRFTNVLTNALQGYAFGAGGKALGLGSQAATEQVVKPAIQFAKDNAQNEQGFIKLNSNIGNAMKFTPKSLLTPEEISIVDQIHENVHNSRDLSSPDNNFLFRILTGKTKMTQEQFDALSPQQKINESLKFANLSDKFWLKQQDSQAGFIGNKGNTPKFKDRPMIGKDEVSPEVSNSPINDLLSQKPQDVQLSTQAIQEGRQTPIKGSDIAVKTQAQIKAEIKAQQFEKEMDEMAAQNQNPQRTPDVLNSQNLVKNSEGVPLGKLAKENPDVNTPSGTVQDARRAMDTIRTQIDQRARVLKETVKQGIDENVGKENPENPTNYGENRMFRQAIEHPDKIDEIKKNVTNPDKFQKAVDQFKEFTDFAYNEAKKEGSQTGYLPQYYSHIIDTSEPGEAERLQQFMDAKAKNQSHWFNKNRIFQNIDELEAAGFHLKNKNVVDDVIEYSNAVKKEQGARVLTNRLQSSFPNDVYVSKNGEQFPANMIQSRIPGMKGTATTLDIQKQLQDLEPAQRSKVMDVISRVNNLDKEVRLSGGLFHIQNTGWDYLASNIGLGRFPRLATAAKVFLSPSSYVEYMRNAINDGTIDDMAKANVSFDTSQDIAGDSTVSKISKGIEKVNPFSQLNKATFGRLMNFYKIESFKALRDRGFIDTSTPEGVKAAQGYGRELNNMFGGQNRVVGDDIFNKTPTLNTFAHLGILAPDYQQGRFKRSFSAFGLGGGSGINPLQRNAANNYAAYTLALRIGITAVTAEIARHAVTGKFNPNLVAVIKNDILDPSFPTPWQNTSSSGNKQKEVAHLPASNISDIFRAVQDPSQFAISHTGAALSDYVSYAANQNYFGDKLSQTNNPIEKAGNILRNDLPIPIVQGQKVKSGKEAVGNALINELGARVSLDPNDPTSKYFTNRDKVINSIADPKVQNAVNLYLSMPQSNPNVSAVKDMLLQDPNVYSAVKKIETANGTNGGTDPIFTADKQTVKDYLTYETLNKTAPGSAEEKQFLKNHSDVLPMIQARQTYYQNNPIPQATGSVPYLPPPQASPYVQQQLNAKNYNDPQVASYLNAHLQYINQERAKQGLDPLDTYGNIKGSKNYGVVFGSSSGVIPAAARRGIQREEKYRSGKVLKPLYAHLKAQPHTTIPKVSTARPHISGLGKKKALSIKLSGHKGKTYHAHSVMSMVKKKQTPKMAKLVLPKAKKVKHYFNFT